MERNTTIAAAILGITAIIFGAFGAHAMKVQLSAEQLNAFETGVKYQMYHALFLLFVGTNSVISTKVKSVIFYLTLIGTLCFSGSLYLLSTKNITGFDFTAFGLITPIGGLLLIVAWFCLFIDFIKKKA